MEYGFDPHDDSDYLTIIGNDVWGNGTSCLLWNSLTFLAKYSFTLCTQRFSAKLSPLRCKCTLYSRLGSILKQFIRPVCLPGNHGIIASKRCNHVTISDNHVYNGIKTGLFLHRSSDHAIVARNHVHSNGNAGLAVLESFHLDVYDNVFKDNRYGVRFSVGAGYNWVRFDINCIT